MCFFKKKKQTVPGFEPNHGRSADCDLCGKKKTPTMYVKIEDEKGTSFHHVCVDCFAKNNCTKATEGKD